MSDYTEQETVEYDVENAIQDLRSEDFGKCSVYAKNKIRKTVKNGMLFLKQHYPDSYVLDLYIDDIDLTLE